MKSYKELKAWQLSIEIVTDVYRITKTFPQEELFSLTNQIRRAVVSIPSNLAEGHYRQGSKEFAQFVQIAFGSLAEVETQLYIARKLDYLTDNQYQLTADKLDHLSRMLNKLIIALRK